LNINRSKIGNTDLIRVYEPVIDGYVNETPRKKVNLKSLFLEDEDPLTAPLTIERTKRILLEIGRIKNTPAKERDPQKSMFYSSPAPDTIQRSANTYSSLGASGASGQDRDNRTSGASGLGRDNSAKCKVDLDVSFELTSSPFLNSLQRVNELKRKHIPSERSHLKKENIVIEGSSPLFIHKNLKTGVLRSIPAISSPLNQNYRRSDMARSNVNGGVKRVTYYESDAVEQQSLCSEIGNSSPVVKTIIYGLNVASSPAVNHNRFIPESDAMSDIDDLLFG
jgi:hypothetical protein